MQPQVASGAQGYADNAAVLVETYESLSFADVHASILHLLPMSSARVLDIGAGTGRDAAAFSALGHRVVAVEPTAEFRIAAANLHAASPVEWIDDSLPDLAHILARDEKFDVVMLTAVWMHLDETERRRAMPRVASLVDVGGVMALSLRHGPIPAGRRMFDVGADETTRLAEHEGLAAALVLSNQPSKLAAPGVTWTRLVFARPGETA